jgi:hypothetical protein
MNEHLMRKRQEDEEELERVRFKTLTRLSHLIFLIIQLAAAIRQDEENERKRREADFQRGYMVRLDNENHYKMLAEEDQIRRHQDKLMLDYALKNERLAIGTIESVLLMVARQCYRDG